jgi:S1-C subfamily serine protease
MAPRSAPRAAGLLVLALLATTLAAPRALGEEKIHIARARRLARDVQPAIVRVQWRPRTGGGAVIERQAVVVDPEGWLLMAGPGPSPAGTLAAIFEDGRAMGAEVWASDARTALTLLRVPVTQLPPLSLHAGAGAPAGASAPPRLAPGFPFLMVTSEGSFARGSVRASHRQRSYEDPLLGARTVVSCLDEAALTVLATDLGAPWLDEEGRIVGLLVGADVGVPTMESDELEGDVRMRPEVTAAYAVPADVIRIVWPLLKTHREVPRGVLGVRVNVLSEATRQHLCPGCTGYEVTDLAPDGPAQHAGVELQDVIRRIGEYLLAPDADLSDVLLPHRPGERIRIGVLRRGEEVELDVVLGRGS